MSVDPSDFVRYRRAMTRRQALAAGVGFLAGGVVTGSLVAARGWTPPGRSVDPHSEQVRNSIVRVLRLNDPSIGTGFCLEGPNSEGLVAIATASHVVGGKRIEKMDGDPAGSRIEAADGSTDVVRPPWVYENYFDQCAFHTRLALQPLRIASSLPKPGERVFAAGFRQGLEYEVVEGLLKSYTVEERTYLVFTGDIAPGFSGGPLLNAHGEVVGMSLVKGRATGNNGALPTFEVINLRERILFMQRVREKVLAES